MTANSTASDPSSLAEIAARRTLRSPDAAFLLTMTETEPYDVQVRTYGDVSLRALRLRAALLQAGVTPGDRVGCYMPNGPCWVVGSLAAWWAGASIAAVGTLIPGPEAAQLFALADVDVVVAAAAAPALPDHFRIVSVDFEGELRNAIGDSAGDLSQVETPEATDAAVIFFTSGTTGMPKGIAFTHADTLMGPKRVAAAYARNPNYRPDPAPDGLAPGVVFNAFGHTAGFGRVAFRMWIGRPSLLVPKFSVDATVGYVKRFKPDALQLTPTMIYMLGNSELEFALHGVKYVTSGTAPLAPATRDQFEARFGVPVLQAYGMTEIGVVAQERLEDVLDGRRGPGSVGRLATGVEVRIRPLEDSDRPEGEGEILARSRALPTEFVGGARVPVDEDGWFATGDIGRFDEEILYITGRAIDKIVAGGFNVYPAEVEDVARRSPLVDDAVLVALPDERLGERPVMGVVWNGEPNIPVLLEHLRTELAHYKTPREVFSMDVVPLTSRDKIDRRTVARLAMEAIEGSAADST
jgi:long-chain acyl-CoA synthetase